MRPLTTTQYFNFFFFPLIVFNIFSTKINKLTREQMDFTSSTTCFFQTFQFSLLEFQYSSTSRMSWIDGFHHHTCPFVVFSYYFSCITVLVIYQLLPCLVTVFVFYFRFLVFQGKRKKQFFFFFFVFKMKNTFGKLF